jgi:hypothetical protein
MKILVFFRQIGTHICAWSEKTSICSRFETTSRCRQKQEAIGHPLHSKFLASDGRFEAMIACPRTRAQNPDNSETASRDTETGDEHLLSTHKAGTALTHGHNFNTNLILKIRQNLLRTLGML